MKRSLIKIIRNVALLLVTCAVAFAGISYFLYYSPQAAALPCRGCEGAARAVTVNGFDLFYREMGAGQPGQPPVVLLHGGPGQSSQTFKDGFDFLAEQHRVIFYDQRGSGNSQIRPGNDLYTIELLVEDLETLRRDVIGAEKMILVAHSAGGALALRYAIAYPQHVEKLILVSALPPNGGQAAGGLGMDIIVASMNILAGNLPPSDPLEADQKFMELSYTTSLPRLYDAGRSDLLRDMGYASLAVNRDITRSILGGNFESQLSELAFPVLVVYGAGDISAATGEPMARYFESVLPNATLIEMEHSGHWPYLEEPDPFQAEVKAFLGK